ncbi:MAG: hypothetical protein IPO92_18055 [Saprospiraceae bacterium]|nr:hypothetical protein [Saprospiraceae bacterium]
MDRGEGQQWNLAPGNLYSTPKKITIGESCHIDLTLDKKIAPIEAPKDTEWVKHIKFKSKLLSEFWGRDIYLGAHILFAQRLGYQNKCQYPLAIFMAIFQPILMASEPAHQILLLLAYIANDSNWIVTTESRAGSI